ncbi:hypothetical protein RI054_20g88970 [Pseudoscourfieldia marina]
MAPPTVNLLLWWFNTTSSSSSSTNSSHIAATSSQLSLLETIVGRGWVTTGCLHSLVDVEGFLLVLGWFAVVVVPLNAIPQIWKILSTTAGDARRQQQQQQRREGNDDDDGDNEESRHNYHRVVLITEESSDEETAAEKAASSLASLSWNSLVLCHLSSALNAANLLVLHYDQINLCKIEGLAKCSPSLLVWYGSLTGYLTSVMICVCYLATLLHVKAWVRRAHVLHIHCPSPETTSRRASSSIISRSMSAPPSPRVYSDDDDYDGQQQQQEEKLLMQPLLLVPETSATAAYPTHPPPPPPSTSTAIVPSHKPPPTPLLPSSTSRVSKTHHHHPYVVGPFTLAAREALYGVPPLLASSSSTGKHNKKQQQQQQQQHRGWLRWHRRTASSSAAIGTPRNLRRSCSMCFLFTGRACARTPQHIVSPQVKLPIFTDAAASFLVTLALGIVAVLPPLLHERARGTCDAFAARWADVVGLLNTAVVMLQFVPQVLTSLRTRRGAGSLSYSTYGFDCIGGFFLTGVKIWGTRERASTWIPYALMHMAEAAFLVICLRDDLETRVRRHQRRREQKKSTKEEDGDDGDEADETAIIVEGSSQLGTSCDGRPYQGSMFVHKRSVSA